MAPAEPLRADLEATPGSHALALVLHGYGDQPSRLMRLMNRIDAQTRYSRLAPYGPDDAVTGGPAWFPAGGRGHGLELADVLTRIDESVGRNAADLGAEVNRSVLVGHSQGAAVALSLACRAEAPWRPAGLIGIAGWLPHEIDLEWDLPAASGTRFLLAHGTEDDVVPVEMGRATARALERSGADVTWFEHPGGHELPRAVLEAARDWLQALDAGVS